MIFYLSSTGNTRWAAERIAQATDDELMFIPDFSDTTAPPPLREGERIGFCFPVHAWRPPKLVRQFIEKLQLDTSGHFVYAVCTAGDTLGEAMDIMRQDLAKKGITLDAAYSLLMPNTYVGLPFFNVDKTELEHKKLEKADLKLHQEIIADIVARREGKTKLDIGRWPKINSRFLGWSFVKYMTDEPFHVSSDRCVKCGICADVCPVHDIEGGLGSEPRWKNLDGCMNCFACYHHCPQHAIEFGKLTKDKGQYFFNRRKLKS